MSPVSLDRRDGIALVCVDNPPVNALSTAVRAGLDRAIREADADADIRAIVIFCKGRTFIAGADIREFNKPMQEPFLPDVVARIEACEKPVIAAIHGTALGGGLEVALGCHYRIALQTAAVGLPEVKLGLLPGASGTQRLTRLIGAPAALDMMLSGNPLPVGKARQTGLIDELTDTDELREAAIDYANLVVEKGPRRISEMQVSPIEPDLFEKTRSTIAKKSRGLFAPEQIIRCVEAATELSFAEGCEKERDLFFKCKESPQSEGLIHSFFAHRAINKIPGINKETSTRPISSVAVLGAGTMGAGIAYNCLTAGYAVYLLDNDDEGLDRGRQTINSLFEGGVARGKLTREAMQGCLSRFSTGTEYAALADVDLVIEAVFENMAVKKEVFANLDSVCRDGAILATNTSTLDVDEIAAATKRPQDVIGLHFFSPAHIMRLLEVVRGAKTSTEVLATTLQLAKKLRKTSVVVGNCYGFVGNRMLYSYGRENQFLLLEGAAPEHIDKVLYDWGMAMGPNAVGDLAGLDVGYKTREGRADLPADPRFYRIANLLVEQGRFGQKTGKGTYLYEEGSRTPLPDPEVQALIESESARLGIERRKISADEIIERCIFGLITEGARILQDGMALRASDIDVIWINGYGFPAHRGGPMHFADVTGLDKVYEKVCEYCDKFGAEFWQPPKLLQDLAEAGSTFAEFDKSRA
ncbi:MAG: 3-hydroxyacyl-CoA dehydrogenase [Woeseiaceae bacterium]|jgi:3-hydroxyacyl-CoA dehydrogenase